MMYSFDVEHAAEYGVDEAIMIYNFQFWIRKNLVNGKHIHEGRCWTYNSMRAFADLFPFWTEKQVRRILKSLIEQGILLRGNFSSNAYDRTMWYAFADEPKFLSIPNRRGDYPEQNIPLDQMGEFTSAQMGKCITDIKPDIKPNTIGLKKQNQYFEETGIDELPDEWKEWCQSKCKGIDPVIEFEKFRNYWLAASGVVAKKRDWLATWRNWCLKSLDYKKPQESRYTQQSVQVQQKPSPYRRNLQDE